MTALTTLQAEMDAVMGDVTGFTGLAWALGRKLAAAHTSPPHVLWMPRSATGAGARKGAFPGGARSVATRVLTLTLRVWGTSDNECDQLLAAVLGACHRRWTNGSYRYLSETWPESESDVTTLGEYVDASIELQLAVLDRAPTTVTVTSATPDTTAAATGDGTLHMGE